MFPILGTPRYVVYVMGSNGTTLFRGQSSPMLTRGNAMGGSMCPGVDIGEDEEEQWKDISKVRTRWRSAQDS